MHRFVVCPPAAEFVVLVIAESESVIQRQRSTLATKPYPNPPHRNAPQAAEGDAAAESLRARLDASVVEAETLATELHESEEAVAARDELLSEVEEAASAVKERLLRTQQEGEAEARRAGEAEALAASEKGERVFVKFTGVLI